MKEMQSEHWPTAAAGGARAREGRTRASMNSKAGAVPDHVDYYM